MSESHPENEDDSESEKPMHAEFQHRAVTARVREEASKGVFANAAIILSGQHEFVFDFVLRMGKPDRVMSRVILPVPVVAQFIKTLQGSLANFEQQFGSIPEVLKPHHSEPKPEHEQAGEQSPPGSFVGSAGPESTVTESGSGPYPPRKNPSIEEIYDELKLPDEMLGGSYANAVLIRFSASEFCFDFLTNIFPRSSVNERIYMAVPQVKPLLGSMTHSFDQYRRRQQPPESN